MDSSNRATLESTSVNPANKCIQDSLNQYSLKISSMSYNPATKQVSIDLKPGIFFMPTVTLVLTQTSTSTAAMEAQEFF